MSETIDGLVLIQHFSSQVIMSNPHIHSAPLDSAQAVLSKLQKLLSKVRTCTYVCVHRTPNIVLAQHNKPLILTSTCHAVARYRQLSRLFQQTGKLYRFVGSWPALPSNFYIGICILYYHLPGNCMYVVSTFTCMLFVIQTYLCRIRNYGACICLVVLIL